MSLQTSRPIVIAGPCVAESYELLSRVAEPMVKLSQDLGFDYVFKASFDKANRTSLTSYRGAGREETLKWFARLKDTYGVRILTDVHETPQVEPVAEVCEVLQIPAFLCRQTDLILAAVASKRTVNVKKGQFLAPGATAHIVAKAKAFATSRGISLDMWLTERGTTFGYGDLVVDMRSFPVMAQNALPVIYDITHSVQQPASGRSGDVSGGQREFAPALARAAAASGYLQGFFLEVHTQPSAAKSDAAVQLSLSQAEALLRQLVPLWRSSREMVKLDGDFKG